MNTVILKTRKVIGIVMERVISILIEEVMKEENDIEKIKCLATEEVNRAKDRAFKKMNNE